MVFNSNESCISSGAVYAYNFNELDRVLNIYRKILLVNKWPIVPSGFVKRIALEWVEANSPIMPVIRRAFGDVAAAVP